MAAEVHKEIIKYSWDFKGALPYVDDWFLMRTPYPMLFILVTYLFFVLHCGKKFMEHRPAYKLNNVLLVYNSFQVALSFYLFYSGLKGLFEFGLTEKGCFTTNEKNTRRLLRGHHIYFIAKLTELLDTVFFVLRKKWNQVSFLHVYHHTIVFLVSWVVLKYEPTYSLLFTGVLNSFVHMVMYTYYGLAAFPKLRKYLWWKNYITKLQLVQFALIFLHVTWTWNVTTCPTSYILMSLVCSHVFLFIYLFLDFYYRAYKKNEKGKLNLEKELSEKVN